MRLRHAVFVLCALVGWPEVGLAGPIEFRATVGSQVSPGTPFPGSVTIGVRSREHYYLPSGQSVSLGAIRFDRLGEPQLGDGYITGTEFSIEVTVTDVASGQIGTLRVDGEGVDEWNLRPWDGLWQNSYHALRFGPEGTRDPFETSADLGGNEYTLRVTPQESGEYADFALVVNSGPTAATPEPGTLLLGALGLAPLGLRRLRR